MSFNINEVFADMLDAISNSVQDDWPKVKTAAGQFFENRRERLALLTQLRINGELSEEKFHSRLEDDKKILEAELNALTVLSKAAAQKAANAAIEVLEKAVKAAISAAL